MPRNVPTTGKVRVLTLASAAALAASSLVAPALADESTPAEPMPTAPTMSSSSTPTPAPSVPVATTDAQESTGGTDGEWDQLITGEPPATTPPTDPTADPSNDPGNGTPTDAPAAPATNDPSEDAPSANDSADAPAAAPAADRGTVPAADPAAADGRAAINKIRHDGSNRYQTSLDFFRKTAKRGEHVILVSGENFPDALAAGALAGATQGSLLLVHPGRVTSETLDAIAAVKPQFVRVVGGDGAVSQRVYDDTKQGLKDRGAYRNVTSFFERLSGPDRYQTALDVASERDLKYASSAVITKGDNFPDALGAASLAGLAKAPLLLAHPRWSKVGDGGSRMTTKITSSSGPIYVIGGGLSTAFMNDLHAMAKKKGRQVITLVGNDRWETNAKVLNQRKAMGAAGMEEVIVASGLNFPDALAASGYAAHYTHPVVLARQDCIPASGLGYVNSAWHTQRFMGGTGALSNKVFSLARCP